MVTEDFRGAESKLFQKDWLGLPAIYKIRQPKTTSLVFFMFFILWSENLNMKSSKNKD